MKKNGVLCIKKRNKKKREGKKSNFWGPFDSSGHPNLQIFVIQMRKGRMSKVKVEYEGGSGKYAVRHKTAKN